MLPQKMFKEKNHDAPYGLLCAYCDKANSQYCHFECNGPKPKGPQPCLPVWKHGLLSGVVNVSEYDEVGEMMPHYEVSIVPMGKPRMTGKTARFGKAALRYWRWKEQFRAQLPMDKLPPPEAVYEVSWRAFFPIPESWSKKKQAAMAGEIHQQVPDRDNMDKAILDGLYPKGVGWKDSRVSHGVLTKFWDDGYGPRIELWIRMESERHKKDEHYQAWRDGEEK